MTAKTQAEIQKEYRDRKRQTLIDNNARVIRFEVYPGTDADIKFLMKAGGFTDEREMLTILIRNAKKNVETNGVEWNRLLDI